MGRNCSVCAHPEREAINRAIAESVPLRAIARRYGIVGETMRRHAKHLPRELALVQQHIGLQRAESLALHIEQLYAKTLSLATRAEDGDDYRTALIGMREARGFLEIAAKVVAEKMQQERGRWPTTTELITALPADKFVEVLRILEAGEQGGVVDSTAIEHIVSGESGDTESGAR